MSPIVYKLLPGEYWRIREHESWCSDMAAKGLHLKKMGLFFVHFVKSEPKKMKYRIDISINKKITSEKVQMGAERGWDYVTSYHYFHVFSSPVENNTPDLYSDPAEQSNRLKELDNKLTMNAIIVTIALILMIIMLSSIWFLDGTPTFVMVEGNALQQTILTIFIGYFAYTSLKAAISIHKLRKVLIEGKPSDHHASWKKPGWLKSILPIFFTVVIGLSGILPFVQLAKSDTRTLPEASPDLPIVRLADVEQNPALVRGEVTYMSDNVDWGNRYSFDWSLLAPVQYETDENGVVPGKMWEDGSGEYSPSIQTSVYQLSVSAMADNLISDLIKRRYEISGEDFVEAKHSEFDRLIVHEEDDSKIVFASIGKAVIHVHYYGYADLNSVIENIVEKMELISE